MTAAEFRQCALQFEGAYESAHMDHPDFRGPKGIFATMSKDGLKADLRLPPALAEGLIQSGETFRKVSSFGGMIWLQFVLEEAHEGEICDLVTIAWQARNPAKS